MDAQTIIKAYLPMVNSNIDDDDEDELDEDELDDDYDDDQQQS